MFGPEVVAAFEAMACEAPAARDVPLSRWSSAEQAAQAVSEGLVGSLSPSTVRRWLAVDAIKPWQYESWIFPRDPDFAVKAARVLDLYARIWDGKQLGPNGRHHTAVIKTMAHGAHPRLGDDQFHRDDFAVDYTARTVTCLNSVTITINRTGGATFGAKCQGCALRSQCTADTAGKTFTVGSRTPRAMLLVRLHVGSCELNSEEPHLDAPHRRRLSVPTRQSHAPGIVGPVRDVERVERLEREVIDDEPVDVRSLRISRRRGCCPGGWPAGV